MLPRNYDTLSHFNQKKKNSEVQHKIM